MDFVCSIEFILSDPCIRLNQLKGLIRLNWIVELLTKPSPWTYLSTERIEVADQAYYHGLPTERKYVVVSQA